MRIFLAANHRYPASVGGKAGDRIQDCLGKGLAELGHDVFYYLPNEIAVPLPDGVTLACEYMWNVDVLHIRHNDELAKEADSRGKPWVTSCHVDLQIRGMERSQARDNWIFVSRTLAETYGRQRYVLNGIDPLEFIYSENKENYFLFVSRLEDAIAKGLDTAISLSKKVAFELVVAGSSRDKSLVDQVKEMCRKNDAKYLGEVHSTRKAELFARAKALLFPTKINESFGLVMVEALMSGTPVICSNNGACPEVISPEVGFACVNEKGYMNAIEHVDDISPKACREKAMKDYHYLRMAADYVKEYEKEIARFC